MYHRLLVLLLPIVCFGQEQRNITLLDNWKNDNLMVNSTKVRYNECWAFEQEGQEYAIIGSTEGTHFFQISDESKLTEVDFIPGLHQASTVIHRDFKTFGNYVYAVCDEGYSSLQIIDISYLPDSVVLVNELPDEIARAHNLTIDAPNELMYVSLPQYLNTGILTPRKFAVYSLSDPVNPTLIWEAPPTFPYVHDCYVRDNIAYLSCGDDGLRVYDFSNPASPVYLQNLNFYQDQGYNHQGCVNGADVSVGSRYVKGGKVKNWPVGRILMSYFASVYVRMILWIGVKDTTAGFKCYKRKVLEKINLDGVTFTGYAFQICMKYAAIKHGFKIVEVPITFVDRVLGISKMSSGIFKEALFGVWKMRGMKL